MECYVAVEDTDDCRGRILAIGVDRDATIAAAKAALGDQGIARGTWAAPGGNEYRFGYTNCYGHKCTLACFDIEEHELVGAVMAQPTAEAPSWEHP